jgi:hypothetical protein
MVMIQELTSTTALGWPLFRMRYLPGRRRHPDVTLLLAAWWEGGERAGACA